MAIDNSNFSGLAATLIPRWVASNMTDGVSGTNALLKKLDLAGRFEGGMGTKYVRSFFYPKTGGPTVATNVNSFTYPTFVGVDNETAYEWTAAEYQLFFGIKLLELDQHGSATTMVQLLESRLKNMKVRFREAINADLWAIEESANSGGNVSALMSIRTAANGSNGTTTDTGANPPATAFQIGNHAVASATTQTPIYNPGNIARNQTLNAPICCPIIDTSETFSIKTLSKVIGAGTRDSMKPDIVFVTQAIMDSIQNLASVGGGNGGQIQDSKMAELGFQSARFGTSDIVVDDRVPSAVFLNGTSTQYTGQDNIIALNSEMFHLLSPHKIAQVEEVSVPNAIRGFRMRWAGQLVFDWGGRGAMARHVRVTP